MRTGSKGNEDMSKGLLFAAAAAALTIATPAAALPIDTFQAFGSTTWATTPTQARQTSADINARGVLVSMEDYGPSRFTGGLSVQTTSDDDFIGLVFGFDQADETNPFFLISWKQGDQSGSIEGWTLSKVTGGVAAAPFANHQTSSPGAFDVIATDVGAGKGWADNTAYDVSLTYLEDRILFEAAFAGDPLATIFDVGPGDVPGGGPFQAGGFGFYNFSQDDAVYDGFERTDLTPRPPSGEVPLPPAMALMAVAFGGLGWAARRRRG